ncbi:caspase family protein [Dactylosporangium sp. NPDC050588]|uniref:caspase family protein n=1 Tax=Dactylosporangium sp. NPDC050588 TaxID=3157211 RepID=UPI0033CED13C
MLIGAAQYLDPDLPPIPSVVNNIDDLAAVLGDPLRGGFDPARIHRILDPALDVAAQVHELIEPVQDTVLVYFAGHGLIGSDAQLYLGLAATRSSRVPYTALQYDKLRQALLDSSAVNTVLVLDCCFSGMALRHMGGRPGDVAAGMVDIEGTYILTATSATRLAHAPEGERNSAFTGELLNILRGGLPDAGDLLELGDIYDPLCAAMRARSLPSPQQRGSNTIGSLALVRNQAAPG